MTGAQPLEAQLRQVLSTKLLAILDSRNITVVRTVSILQPGLLNPNSKDLDAGTLAGGRLKYVNNSCL